MENRFEIRNIYFVFFASQLVLTLIAIFNDLIVSTSSQGGIEDFASFKEKVTLVLIIAPIFETLIFNLLLNELFFKFLHKTIYCILLSSFLFGLVHYYSPVYIIFTFLAGLVFNGFYFWIRKDKGWKIATLCTFLLHFNHNLIGLLLGK